MTLSLSDLSDGLASLVERAGPSVIGIGAATGFAWTNDLAITSASSLRCAHGALEVRLPEGGTTEGDVLGIDAASDLAVVRVSSGGLTPIARRTDGKSARVGEVVLSLARPGRAIRASQRIVGLVGRDVRARRGLVLHDYVEMDRGFPDGFVGGPVVDASGALVGLGTDRVIRGADLAMTAAQLAPIVDQIVTDGHPKLGWLGVAVQPARLAERLASEVPALSGALITALEKSGPADTAGLVIGDLVVGLDAFVIEGPDALLAHLRGLADQSISLRLVRGGAVTTLAARVGVRRR